MEKIYAICSKHDVECYMTSCQCSMLEAETRTVMRLSNKEISPPPGREEPNYSEDNLLEKLAESQSLLDYVGFWPQDPFKGLDLCHQ